MKYVHVHVLKHVLPRLLLLLIFVDFPGNDARAQETIQQDQKKQEKFVNKGERASVYAPNEIQLNQVVGRIVKLQGIALEHGMLNPTDKMKSALTTTCPDIKFPSNGWPAAEYLKKMIASHYDQGQFYLDILVNLQHDLTSK